MVYVLVVAILLLNIVLFGMMGLDKRRAERGQWRISERTLLGLAFIGGGPGALLGAKFFHHKTRKWYFWVIWILGILVFVLEMGLAYKLTLL